MAQHAEVGRAAEQASVNENDTSRKTFEELAMAVFTPLYNFAHWLAQDQCEAEDLVQETYLKALKGFAAFQAGTNFRAWIFRILRNTFLTSRSRRAERMTSTLDFDEEQDVRLSNRNTPESILLEQIGLGALQSALERLPTAFLEVIILCAVENMSYRNIAEALSIPIGTVMSRLARARQALRKELQGS
jgi:RNA polymerase sigma-70 factor (ECF subfamily)